MVDYDRGRITFPQNHPLICLHSYYYQWQQRRPPPRVCFAPTYPTRSRSRSHFVHQKGKILKASRYTFGILLTDKRP